MPTVFFNPDSKVARMTRGYLIAGDDEFEIRNAAKNIVSTLQTRLPDIELEVLDAAAADSPHTLIWDTLTTLQTPSLFTNPKIVWLKDFDFGKDSAASGEASPPPAKGKKKGKAAKKSVQDPLAPLIELIQNGLPEDMFLIINGMNLDRRKLFFKTCESANFQIEWILKPDPSDRKYAQQIGVKIESVLAEYDLRARRDAIECLKEILGGDSARIRSEIEKLSAYAGGFGKTITREDCLEVCSHTPEALSWSFSDALIMRDLPRALRAIDDLITQMQSERSSGFELALLSSASKAFQDLVRVRAALEELHVNPARVHPKTFDAFVGKKEEFPNNMLLSMHPYRAFKMTENAAGFSDKRLIAILDAILATNRELVSTQGDARIALERLVISICSPGE